MHRRGESVNRIIEDVPLSGGMAKVGAYSLKFLDNRPLPEENGRRLF
jgi:hypothetical protein